LIKKQHNNEIQFHHFNSPINSTSSRLLWPTKDPLTTHKIYVLLNLKKCSKNDSIHRVFPQLSYNEPTTLDLLDLRRVANLLSRSLRVLKAALTSITAPLFSVALQLALALALALLRQGFLPENTEATETAAAAAVAAAEVAAAALGLEAVEISSLIAAPGRDLVALVALVALEELEVVAVPVAVAPSTSIRRSVALVLFATLPLPLPLRYERLVADAVTGTAEDSGANDETDAASAAETIRFSGVTFVTREGGPETPFFW
jgi:hypothetical protein